MSQYKDHSLKSLIQISALLRKLETLWRKHITSLILDLLLHPSPSSKPLYYSGSHTGGHYLMATAVSGAI